MILREFGLRPVGHDAFQVVSVQARAGDGAAEAGASGVMASIGATESGLGDVTDQLTAECQGENEVVGGLPLGRPNIGQRSGGACSLVAAHHEVSPGRDGNGPSARNTGQWPTPSPAPLTWASAALRTSRRLYCFPVGKTTPPGETGIHFGWVTVLALFGAAVAYLAFWGPFFTSDLGVNAVGVWQSILTSFGVAVFSAAVLLLFEPKLRKVITNTVTKSVTEDVKKDVREAVQADLDERLAPLSERINSLYDARLAEQEAVINDLASDFTHERVLQSFRQASDVSALANDSIVVQAEDEPGRLHVGLQWRLPNELQSYNNPNYRGDAPPEEYKALHLNASGKGIWAEVVWDPAEQFDKAALNLAEELARMRHRGLAEKIDWNPVLPRFEKGIKVAIDASNNVPGSLPFKSGLVEVAGPDSAPWYLTSDGLHYPSQDWFLHRRHIGAKRGWPNPGVEKEVEKPEWADPKEWDYVIDRARSHFGNW